MYTSLKIGKILVGPKGFQKRKKELNEKACLQEYHDSLFIELPHGISEVIVAVWTKLHRFEFDPPDLTLPNLSYNVRLESCARTYKKIQN